MTKFKKNVKNLSIVNFEGNDYIKSYTTLVAKIDYTNKTAEVLGYWSATTTRHINYAASELGLTVKK